jgi:translation initiation factor 1A
MEEKASSEDFGEEFESEEIPSVTPGAPQPVFTRVRLPRNENELIGVIEQRVGGIRMLVKCSDGKTRNCRVQGKSRKKLWLREKDIVLIELWEFDKDRGNIVFKYNPTSINWLKNKGYLKSVESEF